MTDPVRPKPQLAAPRQALADFYVDPEGNVLSARAALTELNSGLSNASQLIIDNETGAIVAALDEFAQSNRAVSAFDEMMLLRAQRRIELAATGLAARGSLPPPSSLPGSSLRLRGFAAEEVARLGPEAGGGWLDDWLSPRKKILIVDEGTFEYTAALLKRLKNEGRLGDYDIIATAYESQDEVAATLSKLGLDLPEETEHLKLL